MQMPIFGVDENSSYDVTLQEHSSCIFARFNNGIFIFTGATRNCHNHKLQTKPQHCEGETLNTYKQGHQHKSINTVLFFLAKLLQIYKDTMNFIPQGVWVGGGGGVRQYFHTNVGSGYILVQNCEFQYFLGYEDFVGIFCGSSQNCTSLRGHFHVV